MKQDASPIWHLLSTGDSHLVALSGDWIANSGRIPLLPELGLADIAKGQVLSFDTSKLGHWDSGLIEFLWDAKLAGAAAGFTVDAASLPTAARKLLDLLPNHLARPPPVRRARLEVLAWVGGGTIGVLAELGVLAQLLAGTTMGCLRAATGRSRMRAADLLDNIRAAGPSALIIVSVVNFLVGAILAFVGAAQLRKFAAGTYVANLVGIALVREMSAVMTAIVMAGRTGGAYAARIATMTGNEEIDALEVIGIPVADYILLPSVLALVFTMPFLYLYGCLVGIVGGYVVAASMLTVTASGYLQQTIHALPVGQFVFGFFKSIAFAVFIGITSCRVGLRAGRSAADVGMAATRAVVIGIVGVIALDAVFAVVAEALGV